MQLFSSSITIANQFDIPHADVVQIAKNLELVLSAEFLDQHVRINMVPSPDPLHPGIEFAEFSEPGFNAIIMYAPADNNDALRQSREMLLLNRSPVLNAPTPNAAQAQTSQVRLRGTSESARSAAENNINKGLYDGILAQSYADIHRKVSADLNDDPGYQNVRNYINARRVVIGVTA